MIAVWRYSKKDIFSHIDSFVVICVRLNMDTHTIKTTRSFAVLFRFLHQSQSEPALFDAAVFRR